MPVHDHCVKSIRIWSYSGPYHPAFGLNTERYVSLLIRENTDQNNSKYRHFSRSGLLPVLLRATRSTKQALIKT